MASMATTAPNETPLMMKQGASPTVVISTPARAGPTMRARLTRIEYSVKAFRTFSAPTSSMWKVWRVGLSNTLTRPRQAART